MKKMPRERALNRTLISLAIASCFSSGIALANPTAPTVVHGSAAFQQHGNLLQVTNSPNTIINWGGFSIAAGEITRFVQQSAASAVLNRVIGQDPSSVLGALQSNGRVFLINPNGILFGAGAQIDVAGLVASTLNLSNADFLAGRLNFTELPGAGSIINQGSITTGSGGSVYLVAPDVTNSGIITSPKGEVILAAGKSVELVNPGTPNLRVEINAPDNQARNLGQIAADSGRIGIYAGLVNHSGTIRADSAVVGENGQILLKATRNATLEAGSVTSASGPSGGKIEIQSGDTTLVAGAVEAKGLALPESSSPPGDGEGGVGRGGTVHVLGDKVGLIDNARIDASGETGGGTVLVGGDFQGKNPEIQNAYRTYVGPDARISVDAKTAGDGGKVIVWGDDIARFYGSVSARGGSVGGNGGFVEISGKRYLDFAGSVNTSAPFGKPGNLLLDPTDIEINATDNLLIDNTLLDGINSIFQDTGGITLSEILASTLQTLLGSGNVTIKTSNSNVLAVAPGNVTFNASVIKPASGGATTLQVEAENNIVVAGGITIGAMDSANPLNVNFVANSDSSVTGGIRIGDGILPSTIDTKGGDIVLGGAGGNRAVGNSTTHGVFVNAAALNAGTGSITIRGSGGTGADGTHHGVVLSASTIQTTSGNITIDGLGGKGDNPSGTGILIDQGSTVTSASGAVSLMGEGGSTGLGSGVGVQISNALTKISTASGSISITGTGGASSGGDGGNVGVLISSGGTVESTSGGISIAGTGRGDGSDNHGIQVDDGAVASLGSTTISMTGTAGAGSSNGLEFALTSLGSNTIGGASAAGNITLTADTINMPDVTVQTTGTVFVQPLTVGRTVFIESGASAGLSLSAAEIGNITAGTLQIGNASAGGLEVTQSFSRTAGHLSLNSGTGTLSVNGASVTTTGGDVTLSGNAITIGSSGATVQSRISSGGAMTVNTPGTLSLRGADSGTNISAQLISGGDQDITAAGIAMTAGANGSENSTLIRASGNQSVTVGAGGITQIAGGGTTNNYANLFQAGLSGTSQTITVNSGGTINLRGGSSTATNVGNGNGSRAQIQADGDSQFISFTSGGSSLVLKGGTVGSRNRASIHTINGTQTIQGNPTITLEGGANGGVTGEGNNAQLYSFGSQNIIAAGITLMGGTGGINNHARIWQDGSAGMQTISVAPGGSIQLDGGGGVSNYARILGDGVAQNISFSPGGTLSLLGGSGTNNNFAQVYASAGNQTITGSPTISVTGGAAGGIVDDGNPASIRTELGVQTIISGSVTLTGGAAGINNSAAIHAPTQVIDVNGDLAISGSGSTNRGGARMGGVGGLAPGPTNLTLNVTGDVTLTGGTQGGASIGSNSIAANATAIDLTVGGDLTLIGNPNNAARIGSFESFIAGGDISVTVAGNMSMQGSTYIRTLGAVNLDVGGTLTLTAGSSGTGDAPKIQNSGGQTISASGISLTGGSGGSGNSAQIFQEGVTATQSITINNGGTIALQGGTTGTNNWARIRNAGTDQTIHFANGGALEVIAGGDTNNFANIRAITGTQQITGSPTITVTGGSGGTGAPNENVAQIIADVGAQAITASGIMITGGLDGPNNFAEIRQAGAGASQAITLTGGGGIAVQGGGGTSNFARIRSDGTSQLIEFTGAGSMSISGGTGTNDNFAQVYASAGSQTITGSPTITLTGGASGGVADDGNSAILRALVGPQTINAGNVSIIGGLSGISNSATLDAPLQTIVVDGNLVITGRGSTNRGGARLGGIGGLTPGPTDLTLDVAGSVTLTGGSAGGASIGANSVAANVTEIDVTVGGDLALVGGAVGSARIGSNVSSLAGGDIVLAVGGDMLMQGNAYIRTLGAVDLAIVGSLSLTSGSGVGMASQIVNSGGQTISASGITIAGGAAGTDNFAQIFQDGAAANQSITINSGGTISLRGGASGTDNWVRIRNAGTDQTINFTSGGAVDVKAGGGTNTFANIRAIAGTQTISGSPSITLEGGTGGPGAPNENVAAIRSDVGAQTITASAIAITGGADGPDNFADIRQAGVGASQSITITGGGSVVLQGGGGTGNFARIRSDGTAQLIDFTGNGSSLVLSGGTGASDNFAQVYALGTQVIGSSSSNWPAVTLTAGTGGSNDDGNSAHIRADVSQTITAGNTTLTAGLSGISNFVNIQSPLQDLTIHGDLTMVAQGSTQGAVISGSARIGGLGAGTGTPTATNLTLTVDGELTMTGGTVTGASAFIGSSAGFDNDVTISAGGNITLNPGTVATSRIGSGSSTVVGGDIALTAGGDIALNSAGGIGTAIRTTDSVVLNTTGSVAQGADSEIVAGAITINAGANVSLSGAIDYSLLNIASANSVTLVNPGAIAVPGMNLPGTLNVTGGGAITQSGTLTVAGTSSFNASANAITLNQANNNFGGAVNLTGGAVTISDTDALMFGAVNASTLTATAVGISQDAGGITVSGLATFNAGAGPITLNTASNSFSSVVLSNSGTNDVTITDASAIQIAGANVGSGALTVNAAGISQMAPIVQTAGAGAATFNAGAGAVALNDPGNDFTGSVSLNNSGANNVSVMDANAIVLGTSNVGSGTLTVGAGGAITQAGPLTIGGAATFSSGTNPILLNHPSNSFSGLVSLNTSGANDALLMNSGTLFIGASNIGGDLTVSAGGIGSLNIVGATAVGGNTTLTAGGDVSLAADLSTAGSLAVSASNRVLVTGATVDAGTTLSVNAASLEIAGTTAPALLEAGTSLAVAAGTVTLQGGTASGASAELAAGPGSFNMTTSGDVMVSGGSGLGSFARIFGDPDVNMTVGGSIHLNSGIGTGAFAAIEAASPASINLVFPNLFSGGFFVNGVANTIFDPITGSGFLVAGLPAVPGAGFNTTYVLAAPLLTETALTPLLSPQISGTEDVVLTVAASDPLAQESSQEALVDAVQAAASVEAGEAEQTAPPLCR